MTESERRARAAELREFAAKTDDPDERDRYLDSAAEVEAFSLNGAAAPRAGDS